MHCLWKAVPERDGVRDTTSESYFFGTKLLSSGDIDYAGKLYVRFRGFGVPWLSALASLTYNYRVSRASRCIA